MRHAIMISTITALATLAGCSNSAVRNREAYDHYAEIVVKRDSAAAQERQDTITGLARAADRCGADARCVEHVASLAAIAAVASSTGAQPLSLAPPAREPSASEKFAAVAGALSPLLGTLATGAVQWHQADTSRDVSRAQYDWLGAVVHDTAGAAASVAQAGPRITVGGDYVSGTQVGRDQIGGDLTGRDVISGTQHTGDTVGRDQAGQSIVTGSHIGNDDRYTSPGPYTGPICTGDTCQPTDSGNTSGGQ